MRFGNQQQYNNSYVTTRASMVCLADKSIEHLNQETEKHC